MSRAVDELVARSPRLEAVREAVEAAIEAAARTLREDGKLLVCGNGGSASDAAHLVADLMKGFRSRRPLPAPARDRLVAAGGRRGEVLAAQLQGALAAVSLGSEAALTTAIANDIGYDAVFAQQVYGLGRASDTLVAISTSGNSANVVAAALVARARSLRVIALTGRNGGELVRYADVAIRVPADTVDEIQELHLPVYHAIARALEELFFESRPDLARS
jgi:D-sedoheptulose 7-phosphate isomerase